MKTWYWQVAILTLLIVACIAVWLGIATYQMTTSADATYAVATARALGD